MPAIGANEVSAAGTTTCATYVVTSAVATTANQHRPRAARADRTEPSWQAQRRGRRADHLRNCIESAAPAGGCGDRGSKAIARLHRLARDVHFRLGLPGELDDIKKRGGSSGAADQIGVSQSPTSLGSLDII